MDWQERSLGSSIEAVVLFHHLDVDRNGDIEERDIPWILAFFDRNCKLQCHSASLTQNFICTFSKLTKIGYLCKFHFVENITRAGIFHVYIEWLPQLQITFNNTGTFHVYNGRYYDVHRITVNNTGTFHVYNGQYYDLQRITVNNTGIRV